jgi:hypothetical protein
MSHLDTQIVYVQEENLSQFLNNNRIVDFGQVGNHEYFVEIIP